MLTKTQREWAKAQVGKDRVAAVEGEITSVLATEDDGSYILEVTGPNGRVELPVTAEANVLAAMQDSGMTARLEGKVTGVQIDEENGRVGLEISGESGSTVEWVVPEMSQEEYTNQDLTKQAEQDQVEAAIQESEARAFKHRVMALIQSDEDLRATIRLAVADV